MGLNNLIKSSSRAGRFKKKLVSEDKLISEAPLLEARLAPVLLLFHAKSISQAEFTTLSLIATLSLRSPGKWLGARAPTLQLEHNLPFLLKDIPWKLEDNVLKRLDSFSNLGDVLNHFALKSTPLAVNRALLHWSTNRYSLDLAFNIPSPVEVLKLQKHGRRCVTVLTKSENLKKYVLGERDSLSFTMHDLIHADHFYHDNTCFQGQLAFYGLLDYCSDQNHFPVQMQNPKFLAEFDYLISDMNAYAIHLMKCLKSALIFHHPEGEVFFEEWTRKIAKHEPEIRALLLLNQKSYVPEEQDHIILAMLENYKSAVLS